MSSDEACFDLERPESSFFEDDWKRVCIYQQWDRLREMIDEITDLNTDPCGPLIT